MSSFDYLPLDPIQNEIRVIQIMRSPDRPQTGLSHLLTTLSDSSPEINISDLIRCTISHTSLNNDPIYWAISYTWGPPSITRPILLDNKLVSVTENLESALRHLRDEGEYLTVWADAVCINQQDNNEKNWQVQQMNHIYRKAQRVIVWLGPSANESDTALLKMHGIAQRALASHVFDSSEDGRTWMEKMPYRSTDYSTSQIAFSSQLIIDDSLEADLPGTATWHLLARPWWERVWILQEIAVAKEVMFACGLSRLSGNLAFIALLALRMHRLWHDSRDTKTWNELHSKSIPPYAPVFRVLQLWRSVGVGSFMDIPDLLIYLHRIPLREVGSKRHLATDKRDHIYALMGLVTQRYNIIVDYTKSYEDFYTEMSRTFLSAGEIRLLPMCCPTNRDLGLPSWVVDWSQPWEEEDLLRMDYTRYSACAGIPIHLAFYTHSGGSQVLTVTGIRIDEVAKLGPRSSAAECSTELWKEWLSQVDQFMSSEVWIYDAGISRSSVASRTVTKALDFSEPAKLGRAKRSFEGAYEAFLGQRQMQNEEERQEMDDFKELVRIQAKNMQVFTTANGYLGMTRRTVNIGDVAVILGRCPVPLILRPISQGYYSLVGEAYIDGTMDGELCTQGKAVTILERFDIL